MGFYASVQIALKNELARDFFEKFPRSDENIYCNASISEKDGAIYVEWPYEKWSNYEIDEWANSVPAAENRNYLYNAQNEYDECITLGGFYDNPFFIPELKISFSTPENAFMEVWEVLKSAVGEEQARNGLENFIASIEKPSAGPAA